MAYETIIVETRGKVGLITLNRPQGAQRAELAGAGRAAGGHARPSMPTPAIGAMVLTGSEKAFAAGADIKEMQAKTYVDMYLAGFLRRLGGVRARPQADHRGGRRLRAGRRLRTGHDVRLHHRRRHRQVRPAGDHARRHARHGRLAAADPLRRQVQGHGHVPDRPDDGCGRGRALRPGLARRAGGRAARRGAEGRGKDRRLLAAGRR